MKPEKCPGKLIFKQAPEWAVSSADEPYGSEVVSVDFVPYVDFVKVWSAGKCYV